MIFWVSSSFLFENKLHSNNNNNRILKLGYYLATRSSWTNKERLNVAYFDLQPPFVEKKKLNEIQKKNYLSLCNLKSFLLLKK